MSKNKKDVTTYSEIRSVVNLDGEILEEISTRRIKNSDEPQFIKLYLDFILSIKDLSKSLNPILLAFLKHMSYANREEQDGGQIIYIASSLKKDIAQELNIGIDRVNQSITQFVKSGIFKRLDRSKYQVNPSIFGRGEWVDIKSIKGNFDFSNDGVFIENVILERIENYSNTSNY